MAYDDDEIDLKEAFHTLAKHKKKIVFFIILFALLAAIFAYLSPNVYVASASIEMGVDTNPPMAGDLLTVAMNPGMVSPETEMDILQSRFLIKRATEKINFTHRYYATSHYKERELGENTPFEVDMIEGENESFNIFPSSKQFYRLVAEGVDKETLEPWKIDKLFSFGKTIEEKDFIFTLSLKTGMELKEGFTYRFVVYSELTAAKMAKEQVTISQESKFSTILNISFTDNLPSRAKALTNALAQVYVDQGIERKTKEASMILAFIDKQLDGVDKQLQNSETNLENFKKESNMISLGSKAEGVIEKMSDYESELAKTKMEFQMLDSLYNQITSARNFDSISTAGLNLVVTGIPQLIEKLQEAYLKKKVLLSEYTYAHPEVKKLTQTITQSKKVITSSIKTLKNHVKQRKNLLLKNIQESTKLMNKLPEKEKIFGGLQRKFLVNEKIYSYLLEKRATTAIAKASTVNKTRILDMALEPESPIKPKRKFIVLVGLILGLLFGIAVAFIREFLDDKVQEEDIRELSTLPLMGIIPFIKKDAENIKIFESPKSATAEAFRAVRTNLQFMGNTEECLTITVTSTIGGEGKTTVATNLAGIISLSGKKVVILNMDMRKPKLHTKFLLDNKQGVSTLLSGKIALKEVIQNTKYKNLDIISSGPIPPNPSELIDSKIMDTLLESLRKDYDIIIFDTPPIGIITDAIHLMRKSDITLYVLRAEYSKKQYIENLVRISKEQDIKGLSFLLNGVKSSKEGYGYGYGSGYGYYEED